MKLLKVFAIGLFMLLLSSPALGAFEKIGKDEKGDVISFPENAKMPSIDIDRITYYQYDDGRVVISLAAYGNIDPNALYTIIFNTTRDDETLFYSVSFTENPNLKEELNETKGIWVVTDETMKEINGSFDIMGKVLRVSFKLLNNDEKLRSLIGMTMLAEYSGNTPTSFGMDNITIYVKESEWGEQEEQEQQEQHDQGSGKGFPGFEFPILCLALLLIALFLKRKRF